MKTLNLYSVRIFTGSSYSRPVGFKSGLREYSAAKRIVKRLKKVGVEAFASKVRVVA